MKESEQSPDVDSLIDRARSLWREAAGRVAKGRVELYTKTSLRRRAARSVRAGCVTIDHALESGLAVRTFEAGDDRAGFAASSSVSADSLRWALDTAVRLRGCAPAAAPGEHEVVPSERRDLDADATLPSEEELTAAIVADHDLEWVETGITVEVLVGSGGWVAARRRNRAWALVGGTFPRLSAQRGVAQWKDLLRGADRHPKSSDSNLLTLLPRAAAALVVGLAEYFHGHDPAEWVGAAAGWELDDEPGNPFGLAGGSFDDAGFATASRVLAKSGLWVGALKGPGTFRRGSFREPPAESASNLVMPSGDQRPIGGRIVPRCNLIRLPGSIWVLELDLDDGGRGWVRTTPQQLLAGWSRRMGVGELTSEGPTLPAIELVGLKLV